MSAIWTIGSQRYCVCARKKKGKPVRKLPRMNSNAANVAGAVSAKGSPRRFSRRSSHVAAGQYSAQ